MLMARRRIMVTYTVDPAVLERLDAWVARQPIRVSKSSIVDDALTRWLDEQEASEKPRERKGKK